MFHARNNLLVVVAALVGLVAGSTCGWSNTTTPVDAEANLTKLYFDQTFSDANAMSRRGNTPVNREKLRNAGWKWILGSH